MVPSYYTCADGTVIDFTKAIRVECDMSGASHFVNSDGDFLAPYGNDREPAYAAYLAYLQQRDDREHTMMARTSDMLLLLDRIAKALEDV